jgi:hypothetical protein
MIVIIIFIIIILLGILIASSNKRKNSGLFKKLGKYKYEPLTPGFSLEELDNLPLDDGRIVKEYENIADILHVEFGIMIWVILKDDSLWKYSVTSAYKGDFLGSKKSYSTKQEAYHDTFIHILKEKWI